MKKICIIRQPAGLGDILHLFKVAVKLLEQNKVKEVIWPVYNGYNYIGDYIKHPGITFIDSNEDYPFKDFLESNEPREIINNDELIYIPF